jgi:transcriptional antiterminator RfaH
MDDKKWLVIKTNPRAEKQVSQRLLDIGIEHYLPLYRQLRQWKDRKKYVEVPLFSSYVFVRTTEKAKNEVFKVGGTVKYLFVCGQIAVVTEKEIGHLRIFCTLDEVKIEEQNFASGDEVEVISGELIGLRGQLIESVTEQKLKINISSLGCFATINIDKKQVQKVKI